LQLMVKTDLQRLMDILENLVTDQNDVESITVLKDAQAAIYGTTGCKWGPYHN
jgi:hypothetical protein